MFENRNCAHCLFGKYEVSTWTPDGRNSGYYPMYQCMKTGRRMTEGEGTKNSCLFRFARRKNFPSTEEQIKNLWRNRLGRRMEHMSSIALVALVLSTISLIVSLFPELIRKLLGIS